MRWWSVDCYSIFRTTYLPLVAVYRYFGLCMLRPQTAITGHPYTRLVNSGMTIPMTIVTHAPWGDES